MIMIHWSDLDYPHTAWYSSTLWKELLNYDKPFYTELHVLQLAVKTGGWSQCTTCIKGAIVGENLEQSMDPCRE